MVCNIVDIDTVIKTLEQLLREAKQERKQLKSWRDMMIPENVYNIWDLTDVIDRLDTNQVVKIRRIDIKNLPEDLMKYPNFPTEGSVTNGSRGYLLRQDGWLEICILRGLNNV
jgi:hypothetical protein